MADLITNETHVPGMNTRLMYKRALMAFGRLLRACRKRKHLTLTVLSQRTGVSVIRLTKIENATSPPHWPEATVLCGVLQVRVSSMIKTVERALGPLSDDDHRALMTYVHHIADEQLDDIRKDSRTDDLIRHAQAGLDETYCDATIAQWPVFFPPSLHDNLLGESLVLMRIMEILDAVAADDGRDTDAEAIAAIPPEERSTYIVVPDGQLITIAHFQLLGIRARLGWIAQRHANDAPANFVRHIENQCKRLTVAIHLIAPHRGRVKAKDIDLDNVDESEGFGLQTLEDALAKEPLRPEDFEEDDKDQADDDDNDRREHPGAFPFDLTTAVHHIAHVGQMLAAMIEKLQKKQ